MNLITEIEAKYQALAPKRKALVDLVGIFVSAIFGALAVLLVIAYNLWSGVAFGFLVYTFFGLLKLVYQSRVDHYEWQEKYGKK